MRLTAMHTMTVDGLVISASAWGATMTTKAFQFGVSSKTQRGLQVFAVAASSEALAERILLRGGALDRGCTFELMRQLNADDLTKYAMTPGSIVKIR